MTSEVRQQKLDSIARCLERLKQKMPASVGQLEQNVDLQESVMINLERLVQLCVDVGVLLIADRGISPMPATMSATFDVLHSNKIISEELRDRMKKSVGFRNLAVHEYDKIDWDIVYAVLTKHLQDFREYAALIDQQS